MATETRVALVTGANKGIGSAIARALGERGLTVVVGSREVDAGERIAAAIREGGQQASVVRLDVTDAATVQAAAGAIERTYGRLDVLVNNAGIGHPDDGAPSVATLDALRRILEVNVLGALAITQAVLPLLRRSPAGRVVNVSSELGSLALVAPLDSPYRIPLLGYKASKAALDMMTVELARELRATPIKVNAAAPGYTTTDLNRHLTASLPRLAADRAGQTIEQAARIAVDLALLPDDGPTGRFFSNHGEVPF